MRRVVICTGKVAYDALARRESADGQVAIVRVEQLYPWPEDQLAAAVARYEQASEIVWLQEEPENMGAWPYAGGRLQRLVGPDYELILGYIVYFNVLLGLINLVPIPPLDGSNIVYAFVPPRVAWNWAQFQQLGPFLLLLIFWATPVAGVVLGTLTNRIASFLIGA